MSHRLRALALRRESLILQCEQDRRRWQQGWLPLQPAFARVDLGWQALRHLRRHPAWVAAGVLVVCWLGPRQVLPWAGRAWTLWQIGQRWMQR